MVVYRFLLCLVVGLMALNYDYQALAGGGQSTPLPDYALMGCEEGSVNCFLKDDRYAEVYLVFNQGFYCHVPSTLLTPLRGDKSVYLTSQFSEKNRDLNAFLDFYDFIGPCAETIDASLQKGKDRHLNRTVGRSHFLSKLRSYLNEKIRFSYLRSKWKLHLILDSVAKKTFVPLEPGDLESSIESDMVKSLFKIWLGVMNPESSELEKYIALLKKTKNISSVECAFTYLEKAKKHFIEMAFLEGRGRIPNITEIKLWLPKLEETSPENWNGLAAQEISRKPISH